MNIPDYSKIEFALPAPVPEQGVCFAVIPEAADLSDSLTVRAAESAVSVWQFSRDISEKFCVSVRSALFYFAGCVKHLTRQLFTAASRIVSKKIRCSRVYALRL